MSALEIWDGGLVALGSFDPGRLLVTKKRLHLTNRAIAKLVGVGVDIVGDWLAGTKSPTRNHLLHLADALGVAPTYLAPAIRRPVESPWFRTRELSARQRDDEEVYAYTASLLAEVVAHHVPLPQPRVPLVPVTADEVSSTTPEEAARRARLRMDIPSGPVPELLPLLEDYGVMVVYNQPRNADTDAFSIAGHRPIIVANPFKFIVQRQRFDLAHELGHLVMHAGQPYRKQMEGQANRFAAEFLTPAVEIKGMLREALLDGDLTSFLEAKERWGVSISSLLERARALDLFAWPFSYQNWRRSYTARWKSGEPGDIPLRAVRTRIPAAVASLGGPIDELAELVGVPEAYLRAMTSAIPSPPDGHPGL